MIDVRKVSCLILEINNKFLLRYPIFSSETGTDRRMPRGGMVYKICIIVLNLNEINLKIP